MLEDNVFWKRFEKSGRVSDYLEYACTTEEAMSDIEDENVTRDNYGFVESEEYDKLWL